MKILFYVDSAVAFPNCVTAAEILRRELNAEIVMMTTDSDKRLNATTEAYSLFDYSNLFRLGEDFVPVWPRQIRRPTRPGLSQTIRSTIRRTRTAVFSLVRPSIRRFRKFWRQQAAPRTSKGLAASVLLLLLPLLVVSRAVAKATFGLARTLEGHAQLRRHGSRLRTDLRTMLYDPLRPSIRVVGAYRSIGRFLDEVRPDLIVLAEGNVETLSLVFINRGIERGIPTIIVPFTLPNPLEPAQFYKDSPAHRAAGPMARLLCAMAPKWRFNFEGNALLRLPLHTALFTEILGCSSPAPWVLNRSDAAAIALASEAEQDHYLRLGFPPSQLHVIGDAQGDTLHKVRADKDRLLSSLCRTHGFDPGKPLVLCGFPPDQFDAHSEAGFEFSDYESLIHAWTSAFRDIEEHANVLIRPHPRSSLAQIELMRSQGIEVSMEPTAELIPLCDVYVASISATIRWAISCGVPVVNYDTYRYRYDDFAAAAGVFSVESLDEFRCVLRRLLLDQRFAAEAREKERASMTYWGLTDGKTSDRLASMARAVLPPKSASPAQQ